ncbi:hypothetical protein A2U01_0058734, partial [Trifolium medium]|nr:hypothetical protein [Trifolium medium]
SEIVIGALRALVSGSVPCTGRRGDCARQRPVADCRIRFCLLRAGAWRAAQGAAHC